MAPTLVARVMCVIQVKVTARASRLAHVCRAEAHNYISLFCEAGVNTETPSGRAALPRQWNVALTTRFLLKRLSHTVGAQPTATLTAHVGTGNLMITSR